MAELRSERHRLANEVMIAQEAQERFKEVEAERDQARREVDILRGALTSSSQEFVERLKQQELEIGRLRTVVEGFRSRVIASVPKSNEVASGVHDRIAELSATVERLESIIREKPNPILRFPRPQADPATGEFIDISFDS